MNNKLYLAKSLNIPKYLNVLSKFILFYFILFYFLLILINI